MASFTFRCGIASFALAAALVSDAAWGQDGSQESASAQVRDNVIVVTAQRREQDIQDVGISIAAYGSEELQRLGVTSSDDIAAITPGVSMSGAIAGQFSTFTIRGVTQNDFLDHTEAPTAVYVDEGYLPSMQAQSFATFDLERVEVLKGPQGTLFGRNATGGLVHFITRKPSDSWEGFLDATYGRFDTVRLEAAVGGPVADGVRVRVAGLYNYHDEVYENLVPGADDVYNADTLAGRLQVEFDLGSDAELLLTAHGGRSIMGTAPYNSIQTIAVVDGQGRLLDAKRVAPTETRECIGPGGANVDCGNDLSGSPDGVTLVRPRPGGDFFGYVLENPGSLTVAMDTADDNSNRVESYGGSARLSFSLGGADAVLLSDYRYLEKDFLLDADATPLVYLNTFQLAEVESFSQEFRISGSGGAFQWLAGAYYLYIDAYVPGTGFILPPNDQAPTVIAAGLAGLNFVDEYRLKTNSYSAFGQVEWSFAPDLSLIGGLRVVREEKRFDYRSNIVAGTAVVGPLRAPYADDNGETLVAVRAELDWKPSEDALIYLSYNRGVKAGSYNAPFGGSAIVSDPEIPYGSETLHAFELGLKSQLFDRRLRFNAAAFYYDYEDYQAFKLIGLTTQVVNADARYYGFEAELVARPASNLELSASVSYIDTRVDDIEFGGIVRDREAAYTPNWQARGFARYTAPVSGGEVSFQLEGYYSSDFYYSLSNFSSTNTPDYFIGNARIGFNTDDNRWKASLFVDNFTNKRYVSSGFDLSTACGCSETFFSPPRWWGISLRYNWGD